MIFPYAGALTIIVTAAIVAPALKQLTRYGGVSTIQNTELNVGKLVEEMVTTGWLCIPTKDLFRQEN